MAAPRPENVGILALEIYVPPSYVAQVLHASKKRCLLPRKWMPPLVFMSQRSLPRTHLAPDADPCADLTLEL